MVLKLKNQLTKQETVIDSLDDIGDSRMFWHFNLRLPKGMDDGSYNYILLDDDNNKIATGVLQIGNFDDVAKEMTSYTKNNDIIQYNG